MASPSQIKRIGVLGSGEVGQTLSRGFKDHGYDVRIGTRTPAKLGDFSRKTKIKAATFGEVAEWCQAAVLAIHGTAALDAVALAGPEHLSGKPVLDATNPPGLTPIVWGWAFVTLGLGGLGATWAALGLVRDRAPRAAEAGSELG